MNEKDVDNQKPDDEKVVEMFLNASLFVQDVDEESFIQEFVDEASLLEEGKISIMNLSEDFFMVGMNVLFDLYIKEEINQETFYTSLEYCKRNIVRIRAEQVDDNK